MGHRALIPVLAWSVLALPACRSAPTGAAPGGGESDQPVARWSGVSVWPRRGVVEVEARTCLSAGWLEQVACSPNTREHESLLVVEARPSDIHAALLVAGYEPGSPGAWSSEDDGGVRLIAPTGSRLDVHVRYEDPLRGPVEEPVRDWIEDTSGGPFPVVPWVFGGSFFAPSPQWMEPGEHYVADMTGSIVGLVTFGDEVVGLWRVMADQESVQPAEWQVRSGHVPPEGTPVTMILVPWEAP